MVWPGNIDSGRSNSQLGDRSRCRYCNHLHLLSIPRTLKHASNSSTDQGGGKRRGEGIQYLDYLSFGGSPHSHLPVCQL
jgi:hypothetical protein